MSKRASNLANEFNDYKDEFNQYPGDVSMEFTDLNPGHKNDISNEETYTGSDSDEAGDKNTCPPEWVSMDVDKFGKSFYNTEEDPLTEQIKSLKLKTLAEYLNTGKYDEIIEYSRSTDGLINNELRKNIWPILLGITDSGHKGKVTLDQEEGSSKRLLNTTEASLFLGEMNLNDSPLHKDEEQVKLDIKRSFTILNHIQSSFTNNSSFTNIYSTEEINFLKRNLFNLVVKLLRKYPNLNYYQGFHDIASIILIVNFNQNSNKIDEPASFKLLETMTLNHLRDYMISDINLSLQHLKLIPALIEIVDYKMFKLIKQLNHGFISTNGAHYDYNFYQGLSSILTIFSHDIENLNQLLILWDFSLSYNTILINIYIYVAAIMVKKQEIFQSLGIKDDDDHFNSAIFNVDKDKLHSLLSSTHLFKDLNDSDMIKILNLAKSYFETYPLNKLSNSCFTFDLWFTEYNPSSVLLNTSKPGFSMNNTDQPDYNEIGPDLDPVAPVEPVDLVDPETTVPTPLSLLDNPDALKETIDLQNEQMSRLTNYNLSLEKKLFDAQALEESITDFDNSETCGNSESNSLSSSLSSLQSSTSSLNTKILKTSSMYFKRLLFSDSSRDTSPSGDEPETMDKTSKTPVKRNKMFKLSKVYKISLTVGFIGFLLHFLLAKHSSSLMNVNLINFTNRILSDSFNFLKNSSIVNSGVHTGKVGLGNIRNSIYGYMG